MKYFGKILSPNDPELVEKTLARLTEQDTWNDVFSTKLIQLLDNIDAIKAEIRGRSREVEERAAEAKRQFEDARQACNDAAAQHMKAKSAYDGAKAAASAAVAAAQEAKAFSEEARSKYGQAQSAVSSWFDEAQKLSAVTEGNIARIRTLISVLVLLLSLSWIGLVWLAWMTHPSSIALPIIVSLFIFIAPFALKRWMFHAS